MGQIERGYIIHGSKIPFSSNSDLILLTTTFLSVLFIPSIKIHNELHLGLEEFLIPLMGIRLLSKKFFWFDKLIVVLISLSIFILISILVNKNRTEFREYLEIFKLIKFAIIYLFSIYTFKDLNTYKDVVRVITYSFIVLLIFNIIHLFNIFHFNEYVTILYDTDGRDVINFGKNSLGGPGPKRIVGTMGNPNDNAILFLIYVSFFMFLLIENKKEISSWKFYSYNILKLLFLLSMLLVILCQSRTGIVALFLIYFIGLYLRKLRLFEFFIEASCIILFFLFSSFIDTIALQYLFNTKPNLEENNSVSVRLKIWGELLSMWLKKPFFGYGPNKEYVYSQHLYPENEYIFYLWKYGIQGLVCYLSIFTIPIIYFYTQLKKFYFLLFFNITFLIVAIMNTPLSNPKSGILFALFLGLSISHFYKEEKEYF